MDRVRLPHLNRHSTLCGVCRSEHVQLRWADEIDVSRLSGDSDADTIELLCIPTTPALIASSKQTIVLNIIAYASLLMFGPSSARTNKPLLTALRAGRGLAFDKPGSRQNPEQTSRQPSCQWC